MFQNSSPVLAANELFFMYCSRQGQQYRRALKIAHSHSEKVLWFTSYPFLIVVELYRSHRYGSINSNNGEAQF